MSTVTITNRTAFRLVLPSPYNVVIKPAQEVTLTEVDLGQVNSDLGPMITSGQVTITPAADSNDLDLEVAGQAGGPRAYLTKHVKYGLGVAAGTTPSGVGDYNVNISAGEACIAGVIDFGSGDIEQAAQVDFDYKTNGYTLAGGAAGFNAASKDAYFVLCLVLDDDGVLKFRAVRSADAAAGLAVNPTDQQVESALGTGLAVAATYDMANKWLRLCDILVSRDGAGNITETFDNTVRPTTSVV